MDAAAQGKQQAEQRQQMQQMQQLLQNQHQELQHLQKTLDDVRGAQKSAPPPLPPNNVIPIELGSGGLWNPKTGENLLTLFKQGKTVMLPNSNVLICLKRPPPVPCKNAQKFVP